MSSDGTENSVKDVSKLRLEDIQEEASDSNYDTRYQGQPRGPLRMMSSAGTPAKDVTAKFTKAASALETGQLVKDAFFTLFESVGALEIMDPKMDSGYLQPGESLEDDYDVLGRLLPDEIAWQMGNPLSQTLFTSFYLDRMLWPEPKTLENARFDRDKPAAPGNELVHVVFRAYCVGLLKCCDYVHRTIGREQYYEEEDFATNLYHRNLLTDVQPVEVNLLLENAIDWLEAACTISDSLKAALLSRLRFRKAFLLAVDVEQGVIDVERPTAWKRCSDLLLTLLETQSLGTPVDISFSGKIQRRLASSVPPRPVVNIGFDVAHTFLRHLCRHAQEAFGILLYGGPSCAINFVWYFQARQPQPSVYIRCLVQSLILHDMKVLDQGSIKRLLFDSLEEIVLPASVVVDTANEDVEAPHDPRFQIVKNMEIFEQRAADLETIDVELRSLTREQPILDQKAPEGGIWSFPLSSWAFYHKLQQMEWIVQLGFELKIYRVDELGGMYWHLQHLASTRIQHLERIRAFVTHRIPQAKLLHKGKKEALNGCFSFIDFAMLQASAIQSFSDGLSCFFAFFAHTSILPVPYDHFPYSNASLRYALRMRPFLGLSIPEVPTYTEFASLASLLVPEDRTPTKSESSGSQAPLKASTSPTPEALALLDSAVESLKHARKEWEAISKASPTMARTTSCEEWWRADVKNVLRACITANIAVATAKKAVAGLGKTKGVKDALKVEVSNSDEDKGYHAFWVVPKVTAL